MTGRVTAGPPSRQQAAPRSLRLAIAAAPEPVGGRENEQGGDQHEREGERPAELRGVGIFVQIQIPSERIDRRDDDDRTEQLLLERAEIDVDQSVGQAVPRGLFDFLDDLSVIKSKANI